MAEKHFIRGKLTDLPLVAKKILGELKEERIFAVKGKMGAGKTTLIKAFCEALGVSEIVSSPTFAIVNEYTDKNEKSIYHFDFYRIKKVEEVYDIGYEEYLYSNNYCFMEWPEMIVDLLPERYALISIDVNHDKHRIFTYEIKTK
jgi:tRNA threonylcarbamoyladenosine biosynthesis protein TsaE